MLHPTQRRAPTHHGIHTNRDVVRGVPSLRGTLQPQHFGFSGNIAVLPPELALRRDVSARGELLRPSCRFLETRIKTR